MKAVFIKVVSTAPVPPDMTNASATVGANGSLIVSWGHPIDTGMNFDAYVIYHSTNPAGPFSELDTVFNYNQLFYTHNSPGPGCHYYFIRTKGGCELLSNHKISQPILALVGPTSSVSHLILRQPINGN
jgi:hypothetical protein